ncbi:hypothetical protein Leryth_005705 [Lithospermum erythrorhizon]|nr:hypothetical protein Leryth_005705 [Lithospermum erythrorhizon]
MMKEDWLSLVAVHSDSWLLSVVFYNGTRVGFKKTERDKIFNMISDLPTVFEVLSESLEQAKEQKSNKKRSRNGNKSQECEPLDKVVNKSGYEDTKGNKDEEQDATCGVCGEIDSSDEFWIMCDTCERWFHGQCVKITPAKAKNMKDYECADCHNIKARV